MNHHEQSKEKRVFELSLAQVIAVVAVRRGAEEGVSLGMIRKVLEEAGEERSLRAVDQMARRLVGMEVLEGFEKELEGEGVMVKRFRLKGMKGKTFAMQVEFAFDSLFRGTQPVEEKREAVRERMVASPAAAGRTVGKTYVIRRDEEKPISKIRKLAEREPTYQCDPEEQVIVNKLSALTGMFRAQKLPPEVAKERAIVELEREYGWQQPVDGVRREATDAQEDAPEEGPIGRKGRPV